MKIRCRIAAALIALIAATPAWAMQYVSDQLVITLRTGPSTQNTIIKGLKSGAALEVIEPDSGNGYSKVRTLGGEEGWVLSRFLIDQPAARERLTVANTRLASLEKDNRALRQRISELEKQQSALQTERDQASKAGQTAAQELESIQRTAAEALAINKERNQLKGYVREIEAELQGVKAENVTLRDRSARDWFMVGGGVLLVGLLTGLLLSRMRGRQRGSWDTF